MRRAAYDSRRTYSPPSPNEHVSTDEDEDENENENENENDDEEDSEPYTTPYTPSRPRSRYSWWQVVIIALGLAVGIPTTVIALRDAINGGPHAPDATPLLFKPAVTQITPAVTPTVTKDSNTITAIDFATMSAQGYTPYTSTYSVNETQAVPKALQPHTSVVTDGGSGRALIAIQGICTGSATGRCQKVFFFIDDTYLGTDTTGPSQGILDVSSPSSRQIAVTYVNYAPTDPGCCPTRSPVTITYTWDGNRLTANGTPPSR